MKLCDSMTLMAVCVQMCRLQQRMIAIPLEGFLLTPVQKICKYPLQLRELLSCTWSTHADLRPLTAAVDVMRDIASLVNERKRKMDSIEKLIKWQSSVAQWQVGTPRQLSAADNYNYNVSQKTSRFVTVHYLRQILTEFHNSFTGTFCIQFAIKGLLNSPPHLTCVATLPCEI